MLEEYAPGGALAATYVRGLDLMFQDRGGARSYYVVDGLGSTRALADVAGAVTDTYTYDAYGNTIAHTGNTVNTFQFAGQQRDAATGLDYLRARYYDAAAGRFTARDTYDGRTSEPITLNHYLYAGADPVNHTDPGGHDFSLGSAMVGSTIGATLNAIDGTAGEFILNSLEKKKVDWEYIGFELAFSFLPLGLHVFGDLASKFLAQSRRALQTGTSIFQKTKHIYGPAANVSKIIDKIDALGMEALKKGEILWDIDLNNPGLYKGKGFAGRIETLSDGRAIIYLRKGANMATVAEELFHHKQLAQRGLFGKPISPIVEAGLEAEVHQFLTEDLGFILSPKR